MMHTYAQSARDDLLISNSRRVLLKKTILMLFAVRVCVCYVNQTHAMLYTVGLFIACHLIHEREAHKVPPVFTVL